MQLPTSFESVDNQLYCLYFYEAINAGFNADEATEYATAMMV